MAWESRIADESARRVVLAAIMLTLLGAATALAMWVAAFKPQPLAHQLDNLQFIVPTNWQIDRSQSGVQPNGPSTLRFYAEPDTKLTVASLPKDVWRVPMQAMGEARRSRVPTLYSTDDQTQGYGPVSVLQSAAQSSGQTPDGQTIMLKHVLAVATVDGQSYAAFYLTGVGRLQPGDLERMSGITLSMMDTRYTLLDEQMIEIEGIRIHLPPSLLALQEVRSVDVTANDGAASLLIAPDSGKVFFRMHLSVVKTDQLREQWEEHGVDQAKTAPASKLIEEQLKARYRSANGTRPPDNAMRTFNLGTRKVQVIVLDRASLLGGQREWWASELDDQHVLLLEILSDVRAVSIANRAAALIVRDMQTPAPGIAPEMTPESETPSP